MEQEINTEEVIKEKKGLVPFLKKYWVIFAVILAIVVAFVIANSIYSANISKEVKAYLDGKIFLEDSYRNKSYTRVYRFTGDYIAEEAWSMSLYKVDGSINDPGEKYRVSASLLSKQIGIELYSSSGNYWYSSITLCKSDDGSFEPLYDACKWSQVTLDELDAIRLENMCEHTFGQEITLQEATCSAGGKTEQTCTKCRYSETKTTGKLDHNYKNKVCTVCGAEKEPDKANLTPNTWYTYQEILHFQNCIVTYAFEVNNGKAMSVTYYPVCQHCHLVSEVSKMAGPEVNYPVEKIYVCEWCDKRTIVKFEIG